MSLVLPKASVLITERSKVSHPWYVYFTQQQLQDASTLSQVATNTTNIATNTANIATNTANIATNTANITTLTAVSPGTILTTQGDIIYRDASGPQRLGAGTSGQFLQTQGAGANPQWANVQTRATAQPTTSGTAFNFTSLPAGILQILVMLDQVILSSTDNLLIRIGTSGTPTTTGYSSTSGDATATGSQTTGYVVRRSGATATMSGNMRITNITGNVWTEEHAVSNTAGPGFSVGGGRVSLGGTLDNLQLLASGANTFTGGQVNIIYQ